MTRVKVCGLTRAEDVAVAADAGADAIGAIVDVPIETPREVDAATARSLFDAAPPFVTTVLVTMPESVDAAVDLVERVGPDTLQLHGTSDPDEVRAVRESVDADVIVATGSDDDAHAYARVADAILVDSTDDQGAGGTGRTHDWAASRAIRQAVDVPVVLAGGLTPDNVGAAIETVAPFAVDVASGVEAEGGIKDADAVERFVAAASHRRVDA